VPAVTFNVSATLALANFLASSSFGNVSVALACARLRRGRASYETYHVAWNLSAMMRRSRGYAGVSGFSGANQSVSHVNSMMCRRTLLHSGQVNVGKSWPSGLGSSAVNFIGEPQAVHCGRRFCASSMESPQLGRKKLRRRARNIVSRRRLFTGPLNPPASTG
jgi:hypothetical protein